MLLPFIGFYFFAAPIPPQSAAPSSRPQAAESRESAEVENVPPLDLAHIPALETKISAEYAGVPLADILKDLSGQCGVSLTTSRVVGDQRMTLAVTDQPLAVVLGQIAAVLSHLSGTEPTSANTPTHYWARTAGAASAPPAFQLVRERTRDARAARELLDVPRRRIDALLREYRERLKMTPRERQRHPSVFPKERFDPTEPDSVLSGAIFKDLTDRQIRVLARGGSIPLSRDRIAGFVDTLNRTNAQNEEQWYQESVARAIAHGETIPPRPLYASVRLADTASLRLTDGTNGGQNPSRWFIDFIHMDGLSRAYTVPPDIVLGVDALARPEVESAEKTDPMAPSPKTNPNEAVVDLTPFMTAPGVTNNQRNSLPFTLLALAKAAHLNIYQEQFFKVFGLGGPVPGLNHLYDWKATPTQILSAICSQWGYELERQENTCLLRSRTWAFDRQADTSEQNAAPWRERFIRQKETLTQDDLVQIAASFTWAQASVSLSQFLATAMPDPPKYEMNITPMFSGFADYENFRVRGLLSPEEWQAAGETDSGLPVAALPPLTADAVVRYALALRQMDASDPQAAGVRESALAGRLHVQKGGWIPGLVQFQQPRLELLPSPPP